MNSDAEEHEFLTNVLHNDPKVSSAVAEAGLELFKRLNQLFEEVCQEIYDDDDQVDIHLAMDDPGCPYYRPVIHRTIAAAIVRQMLSYV